MPSILKSSRGLTVASFIDKNWKMRINVNIYHDQKQTKCRNYIKGEVIKHKNYALLAKIMKESSQKASEG